MKLVIGPKPPRWSLPEKYRASPDALVEALPPRSVGGIRAYACQHIAKLQALDGTEITEAEAAAMLGKCINAMAALKAACDHAWLKDQGHEHSHAMVSLRNTMETMHDTNIRLTRQVRELQESPSAASDAEVWEQMVKESV